jgi:TrmH family RNA methyltransferase
MAREHGAKGVILPHVHIVLARPSEPRNVGAACRAINNFGITRLTIVTDRPVDYDAARPLAAWSEHILDGARVTDSLEEALRDAALVVGTTRRLGQKRKARPYDPWELASLVEERYGGVGSGDHGANRPETGRTTVAVVFGNEQSGLSDEELEHCHLAVAVPTSPECPSLNLSHAVGVIAYELYKEAYVASGRRVPGDRGPVAPTRPDGPAIDAHAASVAGALDRLGFHTQEGPQGMRLFMRDLIARAGLSRREAQRFAALFDKLAGMHGQTDA